MLFSFHLLETSPHRGLRLLAQGRTRSGRARPGHTPPAAAGPHHAWTMAVMELGSPLLSRRRVQLRRLAMFAAWESADHLDAHLADDPSGRPWAAGWHVRLEFLRQWGHLAALDGLPLVGSGHSPDEPVVAVTLANLQLPQVPRFVRWGRPVEAQVRDDPGQVLALAAGAPPRTVSTFTVWRTARSMADMVTRQQEAPGHIGHAAAMAERERKDFHREFTTLRFRCVDERGSWQGRTGIVPVGPPSPTTRT